MKTPLTQQDLINIYLINKGLGISDEDQLKFYDQQDCYDMCIVIRDYKYNISQLKGVSPLSYYLNNIQTKNQ